MPYTRTSNIAKARAAYGDAMPMYIRALAEIADNSSLSAVERTTGICHQFAGRILRNRLIAKDRRRLVDVEQRLRTTYPDFFAHGLLPDPHKNLRNAAPLVIKTLSSTISPSPLEGEGRGEGKEVKLKGKGGVLIIDGSFFHHCPILGRDIDHEHCTRITTSFNYSRCRNCSWNEKNINHGGVNAAHSAKSVTADKDCGVNAAHSAKSVTAGKEEPTHVI
jgi:hypothetical protein